jgi:uncharacterized protein (UPF0332 family)
VAGRHDCCASRVYYACFQAAIAALLAEGIRPTGASGQWSHEVVQAQFASVLIARRKRYPADLRAVLPDSLVERRKADYRPIPVPAASAGQVLRQARRFLGAIEEHLR